MPHTPPFWAVLAYAPTLPRGIELIVQPLVKSFLCPINASPDEILVWTLQTPPPLETHIFEDLREGVVGCGGVKK